ncbi:hypothetical protein M422DRAFT_271040 [Sphaerobolus stellatus SS14]|uniref:Uncharacterized protein n=1 Tax=Sphaerobolus stellatus (strain SS14) TaxID=990650 RepID=A0A0C9UQV0_SPHS4|nr:hypothetical protein M422DRAFT_271040 [Sphaerobolus stellatus SS14]
MPEPGVNCISPIKPSVIAQKKAKITLSLEDDCHQDYTEEGDRAIVETDSDGEEELPASSVSPSNELNMEMNNPTSSISSVSKLTDLHTENQVEPVAEVNLRRR